MKTNTLCTKLLLSSTLAFATIALANTEDKDHVEMTISGYHGTADKIKIYLKATTYVKKSTTFYSGTKIAYNLFCPHSGSTEKYNHGKRRIASGGFTDWEYTVEASHDNDNTIFKHGYPMPGEQAWLNSQPPTTTHSLCKVDYQNLAVFSTLSVTLNISDLLPLGGSATFPSSYQVSDLKNYHVEFYRTTTVAGTGGANPGECASVECDGPSPDGSPLIIDLAQNGIHLGEPGVGVLFDIDSTGEPQKFQWLKPGGDEAFLVRDLNGNGIIDDGLELFGTGTVMVANNSYKAFDSTYAPNGFVALAQYDQPTLGGNDDGLISEADALWHELLLWHDINANGLTESGELSPLANSGISQLETIPKINNRVDPAGNGLYLWSWASDETTTGHNKFKMVDVFFKALK